MSPRASGTTGKHSADACSNKALNSEQPSPLYSTGWPGAAGVCQHTHLGFRVFEVKLVISYPEFRINIKAKQKTKTNSRTLEKYTNMYKGKIKRLG